MLLYYFRNHIYGPITVVGGADLYVSDQLVTVISVEDVLLVTE